MSTTVRDDSLYSVCSVIVGTRFLSIRKKSSVVSSLVNSGAFEEKTFFSLVIFSVGTTWKTI
jgi:hypothetical protein